MQDQPYAAAIAWHRTVLTSVNWSNLDLRILDGATVVASSSSPRNLYERASFRAPRTGTLIAEVRAVSLDPASQDFAIAVAPGLAPVPLAGLYSTYGQPCAGSARGVGPVCLSANTTASAQDLVQPVAGPEWEFAFEFIAPTALSVTGFEMFERHESGSFRQSALFLADAQGRPQDPPVRTATQWVGIQPAWYRTDFAAHAVPAGARFFVGIKNAGPTQSWIALQQGTAPVTYWSRNSCGAAWTGPWTIYTGIKIDCSAAGPGAQPLLWNQDVPSIGATYRASLRQATANTAAILLTGFSRTAWGALPLPVDLTAFGAPGCALLAPGEIGTAAVVNAGGEASIPFAIPMDGSLRGAQFYQQFAVLDLAANQLGLAFTNGGEARIGGR